MKEVLAGTVVGVPLVNEISGDGIITALDLEQLVWMGLTYGAWFKLGMGVALLLLILERLTSVYRNIRGKR